jgi:arylsulfatase A-like enzyme
MSDRKPNVVFLLSDDMSWADMGCYGQDKIQTPNFDALCAEGMRFGAAYAGAPVCAPSRSCLMQGKHLGHATVRENMVWDGEHVYRHSLRADDVTVAQLFKQAGYATGMFGKWGLALPDQSGLPNDMGFDEFFGYLNQRRAHNYYPPYLWHNKTKVELPENGEHDHQAEKQFDQQGNHVVNGAPDPAKASYSFDLCHDHAMRFVREHADEPFFLYLPVTIPHGAFEAPNLLQYRDRDWPLKMKIYAAMLTHLDNALGELVDLMKDKGIFDDTLFIFVSDNGYSHGGSAGLDAFFNHAGPFKGAKGNLNQGGIRVPGFVRWPGRVPEGTFDNTPWGFFDFLPTACELLGRDCPPGVDGVSMLGTWTGQGAPADRDFLYWQFNHEQAARIDQWYIHREHPEKPIEVYHADDDPGQENDLAEAKPDLVARAAEIFAAEHTESLYFHSPGEPEEAWHGRLAQAGVTLPHNVMG